MQTIRPLFTFLVLLLAKCSLAQDVEAIRGYIDTYKKFAIDEMKRTGVPAAIKLAQGIHETEAGRSRLVLQSNNHFGIKCKTDWTGESVKHTDDAPHECFRKYNSSEDSYKDHSDFLKTRPRYAALFELDPTDFEGWAYGLKRAGYATNSQYPQVIIKLIRDYHLQDYTMIALGRMPEEKHEWFVKNEIKNEPEIIEAAIDEVNEPAVIQTVNYPQGEFKINETKVIYARKGMSYLNIAQQYNIPLARLFEFNDDMPEEETVAFDQLIYLQRKRKTGDNEFHIVKSGETIYEIAQTEAIRLESLLEYNHLKHTMDPAGGEKLYLRSKAPSMPRLSNRSNKLTKKTREALAFASNPSVINEATKPVIYPSGKIIIHTVQMKEGLYSISQKYGVNINDLVTWNHLEDHELRIGQQLKIYK